MLENVSTKEDAINLVLAEVEERMRCLELKTDPVDRKAESANIRQLLDHAERIKATGQWQHMRVPSSSNPTAATTSGPMSIRPLFKSEQIIILKSSIVNGLKFPPWGAAPSAADFERGPDDALFV